jgi:hypothetical protein
MFDRETLRKLCEYPITPSLIGEIEPVKETARERADRRWGMDPKDETQSAIVEANR